MTTGKFLGYCFCPWLSCYDGGTLYTWHACKMMSPTLTKTTKYQKTAKTKLQYLCLLASSCLGSRYVSRRTQAGGELGKHVRLLFRGLKCKKCESALYCDEICQLRARPQHKLKCKSPKALFDSYDEEEKLQAQALKQEKERSKHAVLAATLKNFLQRTPVEAEQTGADDKRPEWLRRKVAQKSKDEPVVSKDDDQVQKEVKSFPDEPLPNATLQPPSSPCEEPPSSAEYISIPGADVNMPRLVLGTGGHRTLQETEGRAAILAALRMGSWADSTERSFFCFGTNETPPFRPKWMSNQVRLQRHRHC